MVVASYESVGGEDWGCLDVPLELRYYGEKEKVPRVEGEII